MDKLLNSKVFILLHRNWRWALALMLVSSFGTVLQHFMKPSFRSVSKIYIRSSDESPLLKSIGKISGLIGFKDQVDGAHKYVKLLVAHNFGKYVSSEIQKELKDNPNGLIEYFKKFNIKKTTIKSAEELSEFLIENSLITDKQDIINIVVQSPTPEQSSQISKFMMGMVQNYLVYHESKEIDEAQTYLSKRLESTQKRIDGLNLEIDEFREGQDAISISDGGARSLASQSYAKLTEESWLVQVRISELDYLINKIKKQVQYDGKADLISDRLAWRGRLVDKIQSLNEEKEANQTRLSAVKMQLARISKLIKPQFEQKIYDLKRKLDQEHNIYTEVQKQLFEIQVHQISVENQIRPYETADVASSKRVFPLSYKLFMVIIFSCSLIIMISVSWEKVFPVVSEKSQIINLGLDFIGGVPNLENWSKKKNSKLSESAARTRLNLIHNPRIRNKISVAFQFLSSRIVSKMIKGEDGGSKVISFVSHRVGEGKSLLSSNIAIALGSYGYKVLIIDTDNFRVKKKEFLCRENSRGFVELLSGIPVNPLSYVQKSRFDNVEYLPSGSGRIQFDLDVESAYQNLIIGFRRHYDFIIVDTPAFEVGPECVFYSDWSDMTIVVSRAYSSSLAELEEIQEALIHRGQQKVYSIINGQEINTNYPQTYQGPYTLVSREDSNAA